MEQQAGGGTGQRLLAEFSLASEPGNERLAMERVARAVEPLGLQERVLKRLQTAVAEATMNAIEHGNQNRRELPVEIRVLATDARLTVQVIDQSGHRPIPGPETPDLEAKLAGLDRPRGWGLFLIENMVDEMEVGGDERHHVLSLGIHLKGASDDASSL